MTEHRPPSAAAGLVAPAAVEIVDLADPLPDLTLMPGHFGAPYRSVLAVARFDGELVGTAALPVDPRGHVSRQRLARGLRAQLEPELREAFSARGLELPARRHRLRRVTRRPTVSVIVATCGRAPAVERCIRSVLACGYPHLELVVVENAPRSHATLDMLVARFGSDPRIRYVEEPRRGPSRARNAGLAVAEGEIAAFVDDDVVVDPAWLDSSVRAFGAAADVACVTGMILPLTLESPTQVLIEQFASFGKGYRRTCFRLPDSRRHDPLFPYTAGSIGSGANTLVRTGTARELGGFDTALGPGTPAFGAEDLDLFVRLIRAGHAIVYEPSAMVRHDHPRGAKGLGRRAYRYGVGMGALIGKQLLRGPDRRDLLRAIPAGVRYARDPSSRKNAGKPARFPRRLDWLERLGLLFGPIAYLLSLLWAVLKRPVEVLLHDARHPSYIAWLRRWRRSPIELRVFPERAPPASADEISRANRPLVATAAAGCLAAPLLVLLGAPSALRLPAVLVVMTLAPGAAFVAVFGRRAELGLVVGLSLGVTVVIAQCMIWFGVWAPDAALVALALACVPPLVARLGLQLRRTLVPTAALGGARFRLKDPGHAAVLGLALLCWAVSVARTDVSHIAGLGLLDALPVTYYVAIGLLILGFLDAATRSAPATRLLALYVVALIVVIHGTAPLLYDAPRYSWTYKHLGVIELIGSTGRVDRNIDIYNNWPAFFAANAWFSHVVGLRPIAYAEWAQVFFGVANVAALRFALRSLTDDETVLWTAAALFVLGNWVGQDYLAPQAFSFLLSLVIVGLCLRRVPNARAAAVAGAVCFIAVVTSHQLSPVMLIASLALVWLVTRRVPLWVVAAMLAVEGWWLALASPFITRHFNLFDVGSAGGAAGARDLGAALPGAFLRTYAPAVVILTMGALAVAGGLRMMRRRQSVDVPACLVVAPLLVAVLQRYGGEGAYRAYLFALPWLAFFAASACLRLPRRRGRLRMSRRPLALAAGALSASMLFAYFGYELANHISPAEVHAQQWYERHAP
ncbi:MAG TPA: glycosyltransferase, partial [Thermoleophilaceae bacterium]|nr:glycosyltransferase [Thermoleophilaceae bacterium]